MSASFKFNTNLDLVLERTTDLTPEQIWKAWTEPKLLMEWFCPRPWKVVDCQIDLRPGGIFSTTMQSPEGDQFPNAGCFLEIVPNKKLVFTSALGPDYRPLATPEGNSGFLFSAVVEIEKSGKGSLYKAYALHGDSKSKKQHEEMGFHTGWGMAFDQMVEMFKNK